MQKILFFDDWCLDSSYNVIRRLGSPEPVPEGAWSDPYDLGNAYPSVFYDEAVGKWRCIYGGDPDPNNPICHHLFGAISDDGIRWNIDPISDSHTSWSDRFPHCVMEGKKNAESGQVYVDQRDKETPYKILFLDWDWVTGPDTMRNPVLVSPDGYHWRELEGARWGDFSSDTCHTVFFNPRSSRYQIMCRAKSILVPFTQRLVGYLETEDFKTFTEPEIVLRPDSSDPPLVQPYGMPVFPYGDYFIGFYWLLLGDSGERTTKGAGPLQPELTYSVNGRHFNRTFRESFIKPAQPGELGAFGHYPCCMVEADDELRIYSVASRTDHSGCGVTDDHPRHGMTLHRLRRDGFMYLESYSGPARILTKDFELTEPHLSLNVEAPVGEVRAQLLVHTGGLPGQGPATQEVAAGFGFENCEPFTGNSLDWRPRWKGNPSLKGLVGKNLRVEVTFERARLYALEVGGTLLY